MPPVLWVGNDLRANLAGDFGGVHHTVVVAIVRRMLAATQIAGNSAIRGETGVADCEVELDVCCHLVVLPLFHNSSRPYLKIRYKLLFSFTGLELNLAAGRQLGPGGLPQARGPFCGAGSRVLGRWAGRTHHGGRLGLCGPHLAIVGAL